ncbi:acyltransferase domain-containing protein [Bifidobacterium jacchi]|uniref:Uncharacterized protein n=1 Tax=Bifidobacterium jacchi TaxID=2490545 RepID=A0A5N5RPB2_9BIFI|nr:acyltransferase domain-containing protein [Bifidobacterium jacchi]KAB5608581.1 hypothetical protein EHS19_01160 [Bifidobacterium jacchi]
MSGISSSSGGFTIDGVYVNDGNDNDFALCARYFGMTRDFYEQARIALDWLRGDMLGGAMLDEARTMVIRDRDARSAAEQCARIRSYMLVFQPGAVDMALAAVMVECLPYSVKRMLAAGVQDDVVEATLRDFSIWAQVYRQRYGRDGIGETEWNLLSLTGRILRFGRLQYETKVFTDPYVVYRDLVSDALTILALGGQHEGADGRPAADCVHGSADCAHGSAVAADSADSADSAGFVTRLESLDGVVTGNRVDPVRGVVTRDPVRIDLHDVELLLAPGMTVTGIHIPADGPLDDDEVTQSLAEASRRLGRLGRGTVVGVCDSWLMDAALERFCPADGNIVRFMRRFLRYPIHAAHPMIIERVFGWGADSLAIDELPERSSLQRRLKAYLAEGGHVQDAGGLIIMG